MTTQEERTVLRRWMSYRVDKPVTNKSLARFIRDEIQGDPTFGRLNAFEILDAITNAATRPGSAASRSVSV